MNSASPTTSDGERPFALTLSSLSAPCAVIAFTMGCWKIAADLRLTNTFIVTSGMFSHWHAWLGSAALFSLFAPILGRYGQGGHPRQSAE